MIIYKMDHKRLTEKAHKIRDFYSNEYTRKKPRVVMMPTLSPLVTNVDKVGIVTTLSSQYRRRYVVFVKYKSLESCSDIQ